jgi:hypothetical protein
MILQGVSNLVAIKTAAFSFDERAIKRWSLLLSQRGNRVPKGIHGGSVILGQALTLPTNHSSMRDSSEMRPYAAGRCSLMAQPAWRQLQETSMVSLESSQYWLQYFVPLATWQ